MMTTRPAIVPAARLKRNLENQVRVAALAVAAVRVQVQDQAVTQEAVLAAAADTAAMIKK